MAIFYLKVSPISRSSGRSAVACACYRSATKADDIYDGRTHDYSHKQGVVYSEVLLPKEAPERYKDNIELWQSVEINETKNARLAREIVVALPIEFTLEQNIEVLHEFLSPSISDGMCADINIHMPHVLDSEENEVCNNPHAHIMLTVRPIGENGKWAQKTQICYKLYKDDEEIAVLPDEVEHYRTQGWNKQYKYRDASGKTYWLTDEKGKSLGYERISKNPKLAHSKRVNGKVKKWNSPEQVTLWRQQWQDAVNSKMKELGFSERIDARSYKKQGSEKISQKHLGTKASYDNLEYNAEVKKYNDLLNEKLRTEHIIERKINDTKANINELSYEVNNLTYEASRLINAADIQKEQDEVMIEQMEKAINICNLLMDSTSVIFGSLNTISDFLYLKEKSNDVVAQSRADYIINSLDDFGLNSISELKEKLSTVKNQNGNDAKTQLTALKKKTEAIKLTRDNIISDIPDEFIPRFEKLKLKENTKTR